MFCLKDSNRESSEKIHPLKAKQKMTEERISMEIESNDTSVCAFKGSTHFKGLFKSPLSPPGVCSSIIPHLQQNSQRGEEWKMLLCLEKSPSLAGAISAKHVGLKKAPNPPATLLYPPSSLPFRASAGVCLQPWLWIPWD